MLSLWFTRTNVRSCRWSYASRPIDPSGDGVVISLDGMFLDYHW
jgi:hypothetical protein